MVLSVRIFRVVQEKPLTTVMAEKKPSTSVDLEGHSDITKLIFHLD